MTAAKEKTADVFPLAALCLAENRVRGPHTEIADRCRAAASVTSTTRQGSALCWSTTASDSMYGRFNTVDPKKRSARPKTPLSWNRYSYVLGDPVNKNDPTGLDCLAMNGVWVDNGDGSGCPDAGKSVDADLGITFSNSCATGQVVLNGQCDTPIYGFNGSGGDIVSAIGQMLGSISAGGFLSSPVAPPSSAVSVLTQCDTAAGCSNAVLAETNVGPATIAAEYNTSTGAVDVLGFGGVAPGGTEAPVNAGTVMSIQSGTFGFFGEVLGFGIGGYISLGGSGVSVGGGGGSNSNTDGACQLGFACTGGPAKDN